MILIINYYNCLNLERKKEYEFCLKKNLENEYIKKIILITDFIYNLDFIVFNKEKLIQINLLPEANKLTYKEALDFANNYCKDNICILSNSDIYFDKSLSIINNVSLKNKFFGLSRYEHDNYQIGKFAPYYSQDSWIFKSPVNINTNRLNFPFGEIGCDGKIAYEFYKDKYIVSNPCISIKSFHVHKTNFRTYKKINQIPKPYVWMFACKINEKSILKLRTNEKVIDIFNNNNKELKKKLDILQ